MGRLLYCFVFLGIYGLVTGNSDSTSFMGRHHKPSTKTDIYIAGFFALSDHDIEAALGRGVMPAIKLALKHINDNPSILPDHKLHLYFNDTKCSASVGMKAFFDMMDRRPNKLMILGGSCTPVTDPIAKTSKHWRVTVLSYADTHPMFTRKTYPNFYRIVPSENAFSIPRLKLLQTFNWTRVGTLYQNQPRFSLAHNSLVSVLDMADIQIAESQSFVDDLVQPLGKLKEKDVRIILANFNATWGRRVFCEVFRSEMYGRRYQWIVAGPRQEFWWLENDPSVNCTVEQIEVALQGTFLVDVLPLTSSTEPTISGLTAQEYEAQYAMLRGSEYSQFHGYAYDAIWTIAQTIDSVTRKLKHHKRGRNSYGHSHSKHNDITDFVYRDYWWEKIFIDTLRNTSFNGVTGPVSFADNERKGHLLVKQVQGRREVQVAEYDSYLDSILINEEAISWVGGKFPPKDRTIEIIEPSRISISVFVVLTTAAVLGIALASSFLAINVRFRNQRNIKMSSPYLNNLIIIGCLLTYTSVILLGLDSRLTGEAALPIICTARIWTLMAGFTLAFGSMFSKTWRVHSIFTDVKLNKKAIKDYQLFMVVGVLLTIDIAILTTWQVIDPFYRETKYLDPFLDPTNEDVLVRPENEYCKSQYMTSFVGAIYAYKGLLMAFGCFLAWETRNVNIPALNDSKYIGMSVYNVVIMCVIGAAISYILSDQQDVSFIIISIFVIFCTTGTLCLVFVPKIIELRHNPQGNVEKRVRTVLKAPAQKYNPAPKGSRDDIQKARMRNAKVRKDIKAVDDEIQKLLKQLGDDEVLLLKDGPSVSVQGCSDARLPSVSGIDTISLSSIISSPDPTLTSPNHIKQNEESSQPNQIDPCTTAADEGAEPAGVAMWSAISNPLLLISHVLKKSMDLGETSSVNSDSIPPTFQCELVIEKHDSPLRATPFVTKGSISLENIFEPQTRVSVQQRSFSLNPVDVIENCLDTSDSSFNRESNTSEDYESENPNFEYKSLESLQSPSSGCTSTFVNYDETETPVVDNFFDPESFSQENQTSSENVCQTDNSDYFHERVLVSASLPRQTRTRKKRQRTTTASDSRLRFTSVSAPDIRETNNAADESSEFEILPIFQQLVAQKHQEVNRDLEPKTLSCPNLSIKCDVVEYI